MSVKQSDYETLLSEYSNRSGAIALLKQYRPYLELLPSMRRPQQSLITIPLPVVKLRHSKAASGDLREAIQLPCDVAILTCDPEWKIKMATEILVFIHRPGEDFSELLGRWRKTQVYLDKEYEWFMPLREQHMLSEGIAKIYPLFIVFETTPWRIQRGLAGSDLPFLIQISESELDPPEEMSQVALD
ncbi:hypothetical protein HC931_20305 [Candidatus Gracilibacteria bacterium]|nr:hypothetical protein [Candidatus Gracilibacteria bacterium]NJM88693.1 hypothetical protein [Hydrococcus sp. RU_2_2]NJP18685.1 hypothetical protein [Hydrococcus sp. CRU_1_1]